MKPPRRAAVLAELALANGWRSMAELGVLYGVTTAHLLSACPDLSIIAVDTWQSGDVALEPTGRRRGRADDGYRAYADVDMEWAHDAVFSLAERYPHRLTVMRMATLTAAERVPNGSLDAVFVDADHRTEAVKADILAWAHAVRDGGMICGHDWGHHSVAAALDQVAPGFRRHDGAVWTVAKSELRV